MIYLADAHNTGAFLGWMEVESRAQDLQGRIDILSYQVLLPQGRVPARTTVFTDHDRFTPSLAKLATQLWDTLGEAGVRRFNDPRRVLNRPQLLKVLHTQGINNFRAFFADAMPENIHFPVFVRETHEHTGSLTRLLNNRRQLDWHLNLLRLFGGYGNEELLIIEFMDTSDKEDIFRKYAAFRIGDRIWPRYLEFSKRWMVKADARLIRTDLLKEEAHYLSTNPHREELRHIFDLAGITYGRVDYGLKNGKIQVWEINTNPQVGAYSGKPNEDQISEESTRRRQVVEDSFHDHFRDHMREVIEADPSAPEAEIPWTGDRALMRGMTKEGAAWSRRRKVQEWLTRTRQAPGLKRLAALLSGKR